MRYNSMIHSLPMLIKSFIGNIEFFFTRLTYSNNELIVVNYHSTPKKFDSNFEKQVIFFKEKFNVISPISLYNFYSNKNQNNKKCSLLFTFDDGLKNNLNAIKVLEKHNISAMLFVVPKFIDTPTEEQKNYYLKNIRPLINPNIDKEDEDFTALSWEELREITLKGHAIGAHTTSHTLIEKDSSLQNSILEIVSCKAVIEEKLGIKATSFCSINNTTISVGKKEKDLISSYYKFHFTTFPGLNQENKTPQLIKRRNIESFWLIGAVYFALGKLDLKRWKKKIEHFNKLDS